MHRFTKLFIRPRFLKTSFPLLLICLWVVQSHRTRAQDWQLENLTNYQVEALSHTAPVQESHIIGWLLNSTSLSYGPHSLNVGLMLSHGGTPSENIVGDLQTFSNLEAGLLYGFNEVFYQYARDDFWLKIGQVDINTDFMFSSNGLLFAHSSFGIDPVLTINLPAPTYPVTGFSITSQIPINDQLKVRLGAFDGQFGMPENNYLGLDWSISRDEGLLLLSEFEIDLFQNDLNQKFGVYHHSGQFYNYVEEENSRGQTAFYYIADWKAFQWNGTTANFFVQFDKAQRSNSQILYYFGGGIKLERYSTNNKKRELGLAFGHAEVNEVDEVILQNYNLKGETVFEASFKFELNPKFSLQPYIQWINIESLNQEDRNPFILAFRAHINL